MIIYLKAGILHVISKNMIMFFKVSLLLFILPFLGQQLVYAQIPKVCLPTLQNQTCCPNDCGGPTRGSCRDVSQLCYTGYNNTDDDSRVNWPTHFFNKVCICEGNYAGYDCSECKFGYVGADCSTKLTRERRSINDPNFNWNDYNNKINQSKYMPSRYVIVNSMNGNDVSYSNVSVYDLFVWMHHFIAKDNDDSYPDTNNASANDFAHESSGFLTWHRLFLLWFEREMQIALGDPNFTVRYWDWTVDSYRNSLFTDDKLGGDSNGNVTGQYYGSANWQTVCWRIDKGITCDPDTSLRYTLRRCPNQTDCNDAANWPTRQSVIDALSYSDYSGKPFNKYSQATFSNALEGFVPNAASDPCQDGKYETCANNDQIIMTRTLHNLVHIIIGIGSFSTISAYGAMHGEASQAEWEGTMADVAASPNDPVFINHHTMIDCLFEQWLQKYPTKVTYDGPNQERRYAGHSSNDCIVPFIPLFTHEQMFKRASDFGYSCNLQTFEDTPTPSTTPTSTPSTGAAVSLMNMMTNAVVTVAISIVLIIVYI